MIHFSTFPNQAPAPPEYNVTSTITSHSNRYHSAATAAPVWTGLDTRTAPTGRGWLLTKPGCPANARH